MASRRPLARLTAWSGGVVAVLTLTSCGSDAVEITVPALADNSGVTARQCARLVDALPASVAGQSRKSVTPEDAPAAAWGDPPIVLRCGVAKPSALRPDASCAVVNNVGWFAEKRDDGWRFTTIGRSTYVELTVPGDYEPAADALVDVAAAVKASTTWPHPCQ